jgi:hypothetical protein
MAVAMSRVEDVCRWCSSTLDQVLDSGDQLYQDSYLHYRPRSKILTIQQVCSPLLCMLSGYGIQFLMPFGELAHWNPLGIWYGVIYLLGCTLLYYIPYFNICHINLFEELDGPAVSAVRHAIVKVKQRWPIIGWVTKPLLSRASPCFRRHVKPLVTDAFAVVSTHSSFKEG